MVYSYPVEENNKLTNNLEHQPPRFVWKLYEIPTLPDLLPLDRNAVFVEDVSAPDVAKRISDVLHERSIEASYNNEKAKVKCSTEDGVEFRVRLYRGRGKFSNGIIAEVQQRFGASINFQTDVDAILDAVQGEKVPKAPSGSRIPMPPPNIPDVLDDYEQDDGSSAMKMVSTMLKTPYPDSTYLGLQTLLSLTDVSKIGKTTARNVSNKLMQLDSAVGVRVLAILRNRSMEDEPFKLRSMAMTILENAMSSITIDLDSRMAEQIRPILHDEIKDADQNPRLALRASRCSSRLISFNEPKSDSQVSLGETKTIGAT